MTVRIGACVLRGARRVAGGVGGVAAEVAERVSMGSARMGSAFFPTAYNGILNVSVSAEGVGLSLFPLFAIGAPPLLIPWDAMGEFRTWTLFGFPRFQFSVGRVQVTLVGRAALKGLLATSALTTTDWDPPATAVA